MRLADVQFSHQEGVVLARVIGDIDMSNAVDLGSAVTAATPNDALGVVLDLRLVDYVDSAGIQLFYRLREDLRTRGQELRLVIATTSPVNHALRLAGIQQHLEVDTEVEEAARALGGA